MNEPGQTGWRRWLRPPQFENVALSERARLLHWILIWCLAMFMVAWPFIAAYAKWRSDVLLMQVATVAMILGALRLLRRSVLAAGALVSILSFVLQTGSVLVNGVSASALGGYTVVVVVTGIFWDGTRAAIVALLSCGAALGLGWAESHGWLPPRPPRAIMISALEASLQVMIVLTLLGASIRSLRMSEARVHLEAQRHARLVARSPDGIFEVDARGVVGTFNPAAQRLTGRKAGDVIGRRLWDLGLASIDDSGRARVHLQRVLADGGDSPFEIDVLNRGQAVPVEIFPRRVVLADGSVGLMATCRDLRTRRKVEDERAHLEELLQRSRHLESVGRLAGGVAHDFNNLLTVMLSNTQLLLDGGEPGPHWREDVEQIESAAKRASSLTQQLLAFARRETLEPELTDINTPLLSVKELLARLCGPAVEIVYALGSELPLARLDTTRFEQIVLNLAANARDAMPEGGTLRIKTEGVLVGSGSDERTHTMPAGPYVWLRVQDDGEGMDEHTLEHVFEPFFTTKRGRGGTGLGLATVHGIVAQSAGFVFVDSTPGQGTAFDVYFPEAQGAADTTSGDWGTQTPRDQVRATLLLVEDEPVASRITTQVLEARGYEVLCAEGLGEAREIWAARADDIRLLLTGIVLPDGMGPDLARELIADKAELHVLYISGFDDEAVGESLGAEASGLTLIRKPISIESLVEHVQAALAGTVRSTGRLERPRL